MPPYQVWFGSVPTGKLELSIDAAPVFTRAGCERFSVRRVTAVGPQVLDWTLPVPSSVLLNHGQPPLASLYAATRKPKNAPRGRTLRTLYKFQNLNKSR